MDAKASVCEHCGSKLRSPLRVRIAGGIIFGIGFVLSVFGLVVVWAVFNAGGLIASGILALLAALFLSPGGILLYVSWRISRDSPTTQVAFRQRLPSFLIRLLN